MRVRLPDAISSTLQCLGRLHEVQVCGPRAAHDAERAGGQGADLGEEVLRARHARTDAVLRPLVALEMEEVALGLACLLVARVQGSGILPVRWSQALGVAVMARLRPKSVHHRTLVPVRAGAASSLQYQEATQWYAFTTIHAPIVLGESAALRLHHGPLLEDRTAPLQQPQRAVRTIVALIAPVQLWGDCQGIGCHEEEAGYESSSPPSHPRE
mmetsp:Transcript_105905/g.309774  ORF Transcript_105905/g.309774 Transcript_105905/m.309774 type:complete len:213 (+) Transcript_105905:77-715(+)